MEYMQQRWVHGRMVVTPQAENLNQTQLIPSQTRIWVDGCFDLAHYGHFRALVLAKRLCRLLVVGVHSDPEVLRVKGPTVLTFEERISAVAASKWPSLVVAGAPYETSTTWLNYFGAELAIHGDDQVVDKNGQHSLLHIREAGRLSEIARHTGKKSISTTALIERVLKSTDDHHVLEALSSHILKLEGANLPQAGFLRDRLTTLSMDERGDQPVTSLWDYVADADQSMTMVKMVEGHPPGPDQRIIYVDGDFDLFCLGHIEFLKLTTEINLENGKGKKSYVIVGLYSDNVVNSMKGNSFPIANIFERAACLLQCLYVDAVIVSAPLRPTAAYFSLIPVAKIHTICHHGVTSGLVSVEDHYGGMRDVCEVRVMSDRAELQIGTEQVVERILKNRSVFEERQKLKFSQDSVISCD